MMKLVAHHLETIAGIEIYPLISLTIFFVFFAGLIAYVVSEKKEFINEMKNLPLDEKH